MKKILRHLVVETVALYLATSIASGMQFDHGMITLFLAGVGLTIATLFIKPIINLLLLPISLITFGLFKWASSVIALYLVTLIVPGYRIVSFSFAGFQSLWFDLPAIAFSGILAVIAYSFLISFISSFMYWLLKG